MTGKELYDLYSAAQETFDCGVDTWEELDDKERAVWNQMATWLPLNGSASP